MRDTGLGISEHQMPELFQEFRQLEAGDGRRYAGTGVGLALSRRLARALGGEIEVVSKVGEGSTFTLVLPRNRHPVATIDITTPTSEAAKEKALS